MRKKFVFTCVVIGTMFMVIGCGGGSSDAPDNIGTNSTPVTTGTAFYVDSAVSGVNYVCGSIEGVTDIDGGFTFEVGGSCVFYLGEITLRNVDAGLLTDGAIVYETDIKIARILQSLDSDGNPDNGITISETAIKALTDNGISKFPATDDELEEMLEVIGNNGGTVVSEEDAQEHMLPNTVRTTLSYMQTHPNEKLASTDCNAYIFGETISLVWVGGVLQTPESDLKGWGDIRSVLAYDLAPADNMMKSIVACNDLVALIEIGGITFTKGVESIVRGYTEETSPFSDAYDNSSATIPGTASPITETLTLAKCETKYAGYTNIQWAQSQTSGEYTGEATACYHAIVGAPLVGVDPQLYIDQYNNGVYGK